MIVTIDRFLLGHVFFILNLASMLLGQHYNDIVIDSHYMYMAFDHSNSSYNVFMNDNVQIVIRM